MSWSSLFGQFNSLFDRRFLLESIGRQVTQFRVQPLAVVKVDEVVCNVIHGLGVGGVVALSNALNLQIQ